jgi:two-component system, cell cycle response regulator
MEHVLLDTVREILAGPKFARSAPVLDELTGTYATRFGVLRLDEEVERAVRYRHSLSCFILELDHLGEVSRTHGQGRVDCVLQDIGSILRHAVRASDIVCRLDGDRFLLITPRQDAPAAQALADRIRLRITRHRFPVPGSPALSLTASVGVASVGSGAAGAAALLQRALDALDTARAAGGNQVALG